VIVVRFASAFARELREELDAMQERLDFLERALVSQRHQGGRALEG
jgi:hypothetical protein